jgi:hypothetical protein
VSSGQQDGMIDFGVGALHFARHHIKQVFPFKPFRHQRLQMG